MEQFVRVSGIAVPMLQANIDTDEIIPVPELLRGIREGYGAGLFGNSRYRGDRVPNPDFILNQEPWSGATILLADRNFGCGSSREAAPKALRGYGFRSIVAPSFSGIFYNNCFRNGLLPVELPIEQVRELATQMETAKGHAEITVDLERQEVMAPDGRSFPFKSPALLRKMLLGGMDEIEVTLTMASQIDKHFDAHRLRYPWAYQLDSSSV